MFTQLRQKFLVLFALVLLVPGCGSLLSISEDQRIYGGVRADATIIHAAFSGPEPGADTEPRGMGYSIAAGLAPFAILDLPLSLVLDSALLPVTFAFWLARDEPTPAGGSAKED